MAEVNNLIKIRKYYIRLIQKFVSRAIASNPFFKKRMNELEVQINNLEIRITKAETLLHKIDTELLAKPFISDETKLLDFFDLNGSKIGFIRNQKKDFDYVDFENLFRGDINFIESRLRVYEKFFVQNSTVLDIGCGRGEMIQVLLQKGVNAFGIEPDESMFNVAKSKSLKVENLTWQNKLTYMEPNSLDGITLIQVIEHLEQSDFLELMTEANRILTPGGTLIIETVNPHSPSALKTFWLDLTHTRPIFPESLIDLAIRTNFSSAYIFFPYGAGDWDSDIRHSGEYTAVINK